MGKKKAKSQNSDDLDIKKDVVSDPKILAQELEVLIKNLNKEQNLQDSFVVKDDQVSDVDEGDLSNDEMEVEEKSEETEKVDKKKKEKKVKEKKEIQENKNDEEMESPDKSKKKKKKDKKTKEPEEREPKRKNNDKADYAFLKDFSQRSHILVKSGTKWFEVAPLNDFSEDDLETNEYWSTKIEAYAEKLLASEVQNYLNAKKKDSENQWLSTVLKSGVLTDKISAYSVLLQENPVQNLLALDTLTSMISLKSRRPCMMSLDAMQGILKDYLLTGDRKLRTFKEQPLTKVSQLSSGNKDTRDKYLILWMFESKLKEAYSKFLVNLNEVSKDAIDKTRMKVMQILLDLLINSPEQEQELLSRLVNKLGDPMRSVAAKAIHQISKLLEAHPAMTEIVMEEIEHLLYRTNVSPKAQYYGICCLTQLLLDSSKPEMATRLIKIYFSFFKSTVKKGEVDTKMVSALLTGVNRAYPFAKANLQGLNEHKETLYKLVHITKNFNVTLHALMLLYQVQGESDAEDRYYSAFYKKLLDAGISQMNKQAQFLNLVFKVLKNDPNASRMIAVAKRMLQIALYQQPGLICAVLYLLSELIKVRRQDAKLLEKVLEQELSNPKIFNEDNDDADDDFREDIDTSDDEETSSKKLAKPSKSSSSSWVHKNVQNPVQASNHKSKEFYDWQSRNPSYAGADKTNHWELAMLANHYHPSVELFATNILSGTDIKYSGDPLQDFTLMRFLDRFVFRNPKKDVEKGSKTVFSKRSQYKPKGVKALAPDSNEYLSKDLEQIPIDERFIYKYLKDKRSQQPDEADSDAASVNSEDFNAALNNIEHDNVDFASNVNDLQSDSENEDLEEDFDENDLDADSDNEDLEKEDFDDENEDSDDEKEDFDDEKEDFDDDSEEELENEDFDDDQFEDLEDLSDEEESTPPLKKAKKSLKKSGNDLQSLLAAADEFSAMIDENSEAGMSTDTLGSIFNKDKSHKKQMKWESKRINQHKPGKKRRK